MNIRKIWLITILMGSALLGIIFVQSYWIKNAIDLRRTIFNKQVNESLHAVVGKLEKIQTANAFADELKFLSQSDHDLVLPDSFFSSQTIEEPLTEEILVSGEHFNIDPSIPLEWSGSGHELSNRRQYITDPFTISSAVYEIDGGNEEVKALPALLQNVEEQVMANIRQFNSVFDEIMIEMLKDNFGNELQIDPHLLDSLIAHELLSRGITTPYAYGVKLKGDHLITSVSNVEEQEEVLNSEHHIRLTAASSLFSRPDELFLSFPREKQFVLSSIWSLLTGSLLLTMIIVLGFLYTIYIIFSQKKLSDIKTDFINNMTHEFKTPIATISLAVDAMNNPAVIGNQERIARYTGIIRDENKRMNGQVEKVLQMALLDRNEIKLAREILDMHSIITTAVDAISIQIKQKGGNISTQLNADRTKVNCDEVHLTNVVQNLLDNANKYSFEDPKITIETWNDKRGIFISISDLGIGMDRDTQQRIFQKFYREPKGNLHDVKGFGLGLTYVKAVLDAHDGSITVKSQPGMGSRFTIYLPVNTKN
ncbi:MAG: two-component system phosphate regulon sensor histidine kinase PhoR [Limisphaerales bacterium]|jgi:two-component system phosphate regulon sensor histidine kinase PhoR